MSDNDVYFVIVKQAIGINTNLIFEYVIQADNSADALERTKHHLRAIEKIEDAHFEVERVTFDSDGIIFCGVREE